VSPGKPKPLLAAWTKPFKVNWEVTISPKNFLAFCSRGVSGLVRSLEREGGGRVGALPQSSVALQARAEQQSPAALGCPDPLPAGCSGVASAAASRVAAGRQERALCQHFMRVYVWRKTGEATEDLCILVSAKFDDLPVGFWRGLCGLCSACLVIPSGVSVAANFSVLDSHLLPLEESLVAWQRDTTN